MHLNPVDIDAFFSLLRAGLWGENPDASKIQQADWQTIFQLSCEQGVIGVVTDAVAKLPKEQRPPKPLFASMLLTVKGIEDDNRKALTIAGKLQWYLHKLGCDTVILKGLGMARNYPNPEHRIVGDIDLLTELSADAFDKARNILLKIDPNETDADLKRRHAAYSINGQMIELHGTISGGVSPEIDRYMKEFSVREFAKPPVEWKSPIGPLHLPPYQFDAIYIFAHFFRHFIGAACGLRQLCDWVLFLDKHGDKVDVGVLRNDLEKMKLMRAWQIFASIAVNYLGMPKEKMLLYDRSGDKDCRKAVLAVIKANHNLAKLREKNKNGKKMAALLQHAKSFFYLIPTYYVNLKVFPHETIYSLKNYILSRLHE